MKRPVDIILNLFTDVWFTICHYTLEYQNSDQLTVMENVASCSLIFLSLVQVLLEMELKDMLNKSNQTQLRMDRSIDISYTDEQMLTALDSLNADSRFSQGNIVDYYYAIDNIYY